MLVSKLCSQFPEFLKTYLFVKLEPFQLCTKSYVPNIRRHFFSVLPVLLLIGTCTLSVIPLDPSGNSSIPNCYVATCGDRFKL